MHPKVKLFLSTAKRWQKEMEHLRLIVLDCCGIEEEFKWKQPCYTVQGKNVVIIHGFKEYCALLFFKGALLKDPENILVQQTENVQAARQIRFINIDEILKQKHILKTYICEAVEVEKAGLKVPMKKSSDFPIPEEFQNKMEELPGLKKAFKALTPGRQRAYLHFFGQAKQSKTREARIEKYVQHIFNGKGLND
ncbi:MAG: YdeI/OmpD-associated family protein [Bacteroidales bacterium]|nr:YdeI/OmpD-associated family protein [Bacteroidales bacterium]